MKNFKPFLRRALLTLPLALIVGTSCLPLRTSGQQALVLLALLWFQVVLLGWFVS